MKNVLSTLALTAALATVPFLVHAAPKSKAAAKPAAKSAMKCCAGEAKSTKSAMKCCASGAKVAKGGKTAAKSIAGACCKASGNAKTSASAKPVTKASAKPAVAAKPAEPKLTEIRVCPMTGEVVTGEGSGNSVVGAYKVFYCCGGCKTHFDSLSAAEKDEKIKAALKIQNASKA